MNPNSDYYPPITFKDMEYIFDVPKSKFVKMNLYNEIETETIGRKTYVSIKSIKTLLSSILYDKKSIQRNIIKRKLMSLKEDKILRMSKVIQSMRKINGMYQSSLGGIHKKRQKKKFKSEDMNLILNEMDNFSYIEDLSIDLTYSEIKGVILEVREMNLVYFTDSMSQRLKDLKIKG